MGNVLLAKLLSFLKRGENDLNATSAGYFHKVVTQLISKKGYLWDYFNKSGNEIYIR